MATAEVPRRLPRARLSTPHRESTGRSQALRHPWTEADFFAWLQTQEIQHELEGEPRAMTGAIQRHDRIVVNLLAALVGRLRGSRCRVGTGDTAI